MMTKAGQKLKQLRELLEMVSSTGNEALIKETKKQIEKAIKELPDVEIIIQELVLDGEFRVTHHTFLRMDQEPEIFPFEDEVFYDYVSAFLHASVQYERLQELGWHVGGVFSQSPRWDDHVPGGVLVFPPRKPLSPDEELDMSAPPV
mgnify:CR=1 FL=1